MENERIDLSSLDPARDAAGWETRLSVLSRQARAIRNDRNRLATRLWTWGRPMLAVAAVLAAVTWTLAWRLGPSPTQVEDPAWAVASWAVTEELPPTNELLQTLGGIRHDP